MVTERNWYIMLNHGDTTFGMYGPIKEGQEAAQALMDQMLATDQALADGIDWEHPAVCAPNPFYESLRLIDLSVEEVDAMTEVDDG